MALFVPSSLGDRMRSHAELTYPQECCGLLLGNIAADGDKAIVEVWETDNVWNEDDAEPFREADTENFTAERRYTIPPQMLLKAQKYGRDRGLQTLGFYHSHPNSAAVPSSTDLRFAWAQYSYIIVSVRRGKAMEFKSWQLDGDRRFQEETVVYCDP